MFRKNVVIVAVALTLSTTVGAQTAPAHPYALPAQSARAMTTAPEWFVRLPQDTAEMTFAAGTATSIDEQMAYDKARMFAERKLVEQAASRIQAQTKIYRADRGDTMVENFEQVVRKNANGELVGAQRVDSQASFDGRYYKVYVLLRLPMGQANTLQREREQARLNREADLRSQRAHQDMEANERNEQVRQQQADEALKREIGPQPQSRVEPVTVPTAEGEVKLMEVDNAEYKRRRDEALQKPGAVIGQTTMR